ncbi:cytokine receptor common subunit gamma-like [Halichoeres trimaculatus]|uniref:cytokine receptor common subunit gamma-like n=1 Tax=Halichoeres trimaculatus TaxID=147232 RepID=UPI003D9E607A
MLARLALLLCLTTHVLSEELPVVKCLVVHLQYVQCKWTELETPQSNYTFYGWFDHETPNIECINYLTKNGTRIGCNQPYTAQINRFYTFHTKLVHGDISRTQKQELERKVLLYPPTNVTVQLGSDSNLWLYWNQTAKNCVESEVRYRTSDNNKWDTSKISVGKQNYCINLPCSRCRYEVQVRSTMDPNCGASDYWSDWSKPAVWGVQSNITVTDQSNSISVWTPVLTVLGAITLILLVIMLLHHERLRIILIPVVPKPSLVHWDIKELFEHSKGLKESFKPNYNELACDVREYTHVSQSDAESLDSSTSSITTDQTDCSVFIPTVESGPAPLPSPQF